MTGNEYILQFVYNKLREKLKFEFSFRSTDRMVMRRSLVNLAEDYKCSSPVQWFMGWNYLRVPHYRGFPRNLVRKKAQWRARVACNPLLIRVNTIWHNELNISPRYHSKSGNKQWLLIIYLAIYGDLVTRVPTDLRQLVSQYCLKTSIQKKVTITT